MNMLEVGNITKDYEGKPLLKGVSFTVKAQETVCLLGSSGSGKSTLLRIICGLEPADSGSVFWQGRDLAEVPVHKRNFGLMFQDYALFPHKNVFDNVAFGLRMHNLPAPEIKTRVDTALKQVDMQAFGNRRVTDLSGGEQQRVAFARAIAPQPELLMLDEPLGALDRTLREQLMHDLRRMLHDTGIPAIYVTHDQEEAFAIADRLLLLHEGRIVQEGTPEEVFEHPRSVWVANFLGLNNLVPGIVHDTEPLVLQTKMGKLAIGKKTEKAVRKGQEVTLLIGIGAAKLIRKSTKSINQINGRVEDVFFAVMDTACNHNLLEESCLNS